MDATHIRLATRLAALTRDVDASYAAVLDQGGYLFGCPTPLGDEERAQLNRLMDAAIRRKAARPHGASVVHEPEGPCAIAAPFGGVYELVVVFGGEPDLAALRASVAVVERAVPAIEALTVLLPPDDPGGTRASAAMRR